MQCGTEPVATGILDSGFWTSLFLEAQASGIGWSLFPGDSGLHSSSYAKQQPSQGQGVLGVPGSPEDPGSPLCLCCQGTRARLPNFLVWIFPQHISAQATQTFLCSGDPVPSLIARGLVTRPQSF